MSSRGFMVDMIDSIGNKVAGTSHIEELLRKTEDKDKKDKIKQLKNKALYLRRKQQSRLLDFAEIPDPDLHCIFKHYAGAFIEDTEVYEATGDDKDLEIAKESADLLAMVISLYLGMEFEKCANCLWDKMLVQQYEKERSATMKENEGDINNG